MATCAHFAWLNVDCSGGRRDVTYGKRLHRLVEELRDPDRQQVSIQFFFGKKAKTRALQSVFNNNNTTRRRAHGIGNLHLDVNSISSDRPVMFVDCTPGASSVESQVTRPLCHEVVRRQLDWGGAMIAVDLCARVMSRLLFGMVDVVCVFVDDLGGPDGCLAWLQRWALEPGSSSTEASMQPHLLLVGEGKAEDRLRHAVKTVFAKVEFVNLGRASSTPATDYLLLKRRLQHHVDELGQERKLHRTLFRAVHLPQIFEMWLHHFAQELEPFPLITAMCRIKARGDCRTHIAHLIDIATRSSVPMTAISTFIASTCGLEGHPSRAHCE
jgi:hypothetical protein